MHDRKISAGKMPGSSLNMSSEKTGIKLKINGIHLVGLVTEKDAAFKINHIQT